MDNPFDIGKKIGEDVMRHVSANIAHAASAAMDGAMKQAPMLDDLLNGKPVVVLISPIEIAPITVQIIPKK